MNIAPFARPNFLFPQKNKKFQEQLWNSWSRTAVAYQIYVRSFKDSDGDGVGDLQGVIDKLDYLNDGTSNSLGIGAIWLTPFYKSPMADFGYDISDYYDVDPLFGEVETFEKLCKEAHQRGIKIIIDFVSNHTSDKHSWFEQSRSSKDNPMRDWYIWKKGKPDGSLPNNWLSVFGDEAWEFDERTGEYYLHSFLKDQPDLNWRNPEVQKEMLKVLDFWISKGADGVRIDVANHLIKDGQFRDEPVNENYRDYPGAQTWHKQLHPYMRNRPETLGVLNELSEFVAGYGDKFIVTEANLTPEKMAEYHQACPNKRLSPLNFSFTKLPWQAKEFKKAIDAYDKVLSNLDQPSNFFSNHDRARLISKMGTDYARVAAMLLLTIKGLPFVYYGEELGMEDVDIPQELVQDNFGLQNPGQGRDPERTPMPWDDSLKGGFTTGSPWLPLGGNTKKSVKLQEKDYHSILSLYKRLIHFRNGSKILQRGSYKSIETLDEDVFVFTREYLGEKLLVVLNFNEVKKKLDLSGLQRFGKIVLDTNLKKDDQLVVLHELNLEGNEGLLIRL